VEPAGAAYYCVPRVLTTVHVDTASLGGRMIIHGLKDANAFKKLVWAMKRRDANDRNDAARGFIESSTYVAPCLNTIETDSSVNNLLSDIRKELKENKELLKSTTRSSSQQQQQQQQTSTPSEQHIGVFEMV
jgi:hypothetical protein